VWRPTTSSGTGSTGCDSGASVRPFRRLAAGLVVAIAWDARTRRSWHGATTEKPNPLNYRVARRFSGRHADHRQVVY
jgi:hypothetical protein